MSSHISNFLERQNKYNLQAFGADVTSYEQNGDYIQARDAARSLSRTAGNLLHSNHPQDVEAVPYINSHFDTYDQVAANEELKDKLSRPLGHTILNWLSQAPTGDIVTFSTWNTDRQQTFQRQLNMDQILLQQDTIARVEKLIDIGLYPKNATGLYLGAMERYGKFKAIDSFTSGGMLADGYCDDTTIALANRYEKPDILKDPGYTMKEISFHEYTHGAGWQRGFLSGIYTKHSRLRILEEAFVTHVSNVAMVESDGDDPLFDHAPHVIHPQKRIADVGRYAVERELLDVIAKGDADGPIPIDFMAETYFSPFDTKGGINRRQELERRIGAFFGNIERFYALNDAYNQEPSDEQRTGLLDAAIGEFQEESLAIEHIHESVPMAGPSPFAIIDRGAMVRL